MPIGSVGCKRLLYTYILNNFDMLPIAFKYRIYPSNPQKELIAKHIGSSRFVYNLALKTKNAAYIGNNHNYSAFDLIKQLPKFKEGIKISLHRPIKGTIKSAIISVTPTGNYFVSILCDTKEEIPSKAPIKENTTIGVALGIKDFAITSEGEVFENPKYLRKAQSKLKYVPHKYSKYKGKRSKQKLAKLQEDVVHKRKNFLHKVATQLVRENQTIALETLAVKNRVKNHHLAQAISDVSWSTFVTYNCLTSHCNSLNYNCKRPD